MTFRRLLCLLVLAVLLQPLSMALEGADRPNIIFIMADDLGWKDIGCYGGPVKTPALDALATGGFRFTDFYSGAAVCSPSRATLLTGRQHLRAGVFSWIDDHTQKSHLLEREVTLAEILKAHGYSTVHLGKWHLGLPTRAHEKPTPGQHGFDYWFATANNAQPSHKDPVNFIRNGKPVGKIKGYASQILVDEAIAWLDGKREPGKPFFLNLWFHEPHAPIAAPERSVAPYGELNDPGAIYSGTIDNTDRAIARLLKKLAQVDAPENTLIIYSSDNGSYRNDRTGHLRGAKGSNFEGGIRVPLVVRWPGTVPAGKTCSTPTSNVDFYPTFLAAAGVTPDPKQKLDGISILAQLKKPGNELRKAPLFWHYPLAKPHFLGGHSGGAIRQGPWKLIEWFDTGKVELFNIEEDRGEVNDLFAQRRKTSELLLSQLRSWRKELGAKTTVAKK